jgi:hypothetical protein
MTRDDFFDDIHQMFCLLAQLGIPKALEDEAVEKIAAMKAGGPGITPDELQRYSDAIDWAHQNDAEVLRDLARVLLRLVGGLGAELESFRRARE